MPFLQFTFEVGAADPEPLEEALFAAGAISVTLEDAADSPILEPAPGAMPLWPTVRIKAVFEHDVAPDRVIAALRSQFGSSLPNHSFEQLADRAWEREWLKDFRPMRFGRRLWICPGGQEPAASDSSLCLVYLDPGLAFGTGTHATTALCLEWLDAADLDGRTVLDYGCGSGILAIAALRLGAEHALCIDIDRQALIATHDNAERNAVSDRIATSLVNEEKPPAASDIVLANILAAPLLTLAPTLAGLVKPGGDLVLSGLLEEQALAVTQRYGAWFDMGLPASRDGWVRLHGRRRAP
jgi:ribosomal protein L11 methyltransferase